MAEMNIIDAMQIHLGNCLAGALSITLINPFNWIYKYSFTPLTESNYIKLSSFMAVEHRRMKSMAIFFY